MIGDSEWDLKFAQNCGINFALVLSGVTKQTDNGIIE